MPLIINTNVVSLTAQRHLGANTNALNKSMEKLASGYRINRASDDAAGLQLSESLRAQIRGSKKALDNIQDGIGVLNIVDGAYQQMTENLQRMRELAVQAGNDTYSLAERQAMQREVDQLYYEWDRIALSTEFNGVKLLDGTAGSLVLQVGANDVAANDTLDITSALGDATLQAGFGLGFGSIGIQASTAVLSTIGNLDDVLDDLNSRRGLLGAFTNRLEGAANNLSISIENLSASESRIRNVDVASESSSLTRNQILQQAASTILSQANQAPTLALQLLQGK